jgi:hypothetical protein
LHFSSDEKVMKFIAQCTLLGALGLFGQGGEAQASVCGGDYVRVDEALLHPAALPDRSALAELASLADFAGPERCLGVPVDVTAPSAVERRLACSAVIDALQMLDHCGISPRKPLCG